MAVPVLIQVLPAALAGLGAVIDKQNRWRGLLIGTLPEVKRLV
jgi:hypothetical protein